VFHNLKYDKRSTRKGNVYKMHHPNIISGHSAGHSTGPEQYKGMKWPNVNSKTCSKLNRGKAMPKRNQQVLSDENKKICSRKQGLVFDGI
jgi:hypothetical protein